MRERKGRMETSQGKRHVGKVTGVKSSCLRIKTCIKWKCKVSEVQQVMVADDEEGEQETELNHQQCFNKQLEATEATAYRWHFARNRQRCDFVSPSIHPFVRPSILLAAQSGPGEAPWRRHCRWRWWRLAAVAYAAAGPRVYQLLISRLCGCCAAATMCNTTLRQQHIVGTAKLCLLRYEVVFDLFIYLFSLFFFFTLMLVFFVCRSHTHSWQEFPSF